MYKKCLIFLLALLIMGCSSVAFAKLRVVVVNNTGATIQTISISPTGSSEWIDISNFEGGALYDGDTARLNLNFNSGQNIRYWDLMATFQNGKNWSWDEFDFMNISKITLNSDGSASYE